MTIRRAAAGDAGAIAAIYAPFVTASPVSFEIEPPDAAEMARRIEAGGDLYPWLVKTDGDGAVLGYAYAAAFRARRAYRFTVETSVYVAPGAQRQGIATALYAALLEMLEAQGFTQAIAAITIPNPPSIRLHEAFGFIRAGAYQNVGFKLGQWLTVGLWQRPLAPMADPPGEPRPFPDL